MTIASWVSTPGAAGGKLVGSEARGGMPRESASERRSVPPEEGAPAIRSGSVSRALACPGVELISGPGRSAYRSGNLMFRYHANDVDVILKVYRRRKSAWNDFWAGFSERWIERKRGASATRRCATEAACLAVWRAAGFDVPKLLRRAPPDWAGSHPSLWLEYVEGQTLHAQLEDPGVPEARKRDWIARLGAEHGRRHRLALERGEILLVQEHATPRHVLVSGPRLVGFDFEHAYQPGFPIATALAFELASTLRALWRDPARPDAHVDVFLESHAEPEIVRESCRQFASGAWRWRIYRGLETRQRRVRSKTETMHRVAERWGIATSGFGLATT